MQIQMAHSTHAPIAKVQYLHIVVTILTDARWWDKFIMFRYISDRKSVYVYICVTSERILYPVGPVPDLKQERQ